MRSHQERVLVSGAGFAGLATAYWLRQLGYEVTIVEIARGLRRGGTAVNIQDGCIDVVQRMGLLEQIRANRLNLQRWEFKNAADVTVRALTIRADGEAPPENDIEIERDVLLDLLFANVKDDAEIIFDDSITALRETPDGMEVTFANSSPQTFGLVFGCDGTHSAVRKIWFGPDAQHSHFLGQYFSITIVDKLLIERDTAQMFNVPGKAVMLNAYKDRTDIILTFATDTKISYDHRDQRQQRRIIADRFADVGWRTSELLAEIQDSTSFYFDELGQIRMPSWTKGLVALVGDAGYCASPAAGRGGSLALDGAGALATAMRKHNGYVQQAFRDYDERLRPFIEQVQADAVKVGLESLVPLTEEAIDARNARSGSSF
ncbi:FAD-binding monooxygenase [Mycolicibacterium sp. P9-64]|nr:FAD-binding monooxygenase [Mycolicibacterium sp. P9-64]